MTLIETLKDFIIVFGYYRPRSDVGKSDFNRRLDESEKIGSDDNIHIFLPQILFGECYE